VTTARLLAQMERRVLAVAEDPELIQRAQRRAEHVLRDFCGELGWTVEVRWR